jgi:hypothetical protein
VLSSRELVINHVPFEQHREYESYIKKLMEGNHCGLFMVVTQNLLGGSEETHNKLTVIVAGLCIEILISQLQNTRQDTVDSCGSSADCHRNQLYCLCSPLYKSVG